MKTADALFSAPSLAMLLLAGAALCAQPAQAAQDFPEKPAATVRSKIAGAGAKAKATIRKVLIDNDDVDPDGDEPDVRNSSVADYHCELGNFLTVYKNDTDASNIALRWKNRIHRLVRVSTTTGAQRYENAANGLTWITIPAKGLLLHGKKARQLANECVLKKVLEVKSDAPAAPAAPAVAAPEGADTPEARQNEKTAAASLPAQGAAAVIAATPADAVPAGAQ